MIPLEKDAVLYSKTGKLESSGPVWMQEFRPASSTIFAQVRLSMLRPEGISQWWKNYRGADPHHVSNWIYFFEDYPLTFAFRCLRFHHVMRSAKAERSRVESPALPVR